VASGMAAGGALGVVGGGSPYRFRAVLTAASATAICAAACARHWTAAPPGELVPNVGRRAGAGAAAPAGATSAAAPAGVSAGGAAGAGALAPAVGLGGLVAAPGVAAQPAPAGAPSLPVAAGAAASEAAGGGVAAGAAAPALGGAAAGPAGGGAAVAATVTAAARAAGGALGAGAPAAGSDGLGDHFDLRVVRAWLGFRDGPFLDWPTEGPRSCLGVCCYIGQNGGSPMGRHARWKHDAQLQALDAGVAEHERCCQHLEAMALYDQMNLPSCATAEHLAHPVQMQQVNWRERLSGHKYDSVGDSHLYYGADIIRSGACACLELTEWAATALGREH
ncbi:unnamed protein product, partial [Prorocentrum cordatum]